MRNPVDTIIEAVFPGWGLSRRQARKAISYYEAAKPDRLRKRKRERGSADTATQRAGNSLREQARHLEQNLDLAKGVLDILVRNVVGPFGIGIEPQPRDVDGQINDQLAKNILALLADWSKRPDVTWRHPWPSAQRLICRSWLRDGDALAQILEGSVPLLDHGTRVPLSLELLEADFLPSDLNDLKRNIVGGIEMNQWGRPVAYHLHKSHPGDRLRLLRPTNTKRVPAARMLHLPVLDRLHQTRGVSIFASVLSRVEDIKDYEDSERIAAKVAASMAAFIKKGMPDQYSVETDDDGDPTPRDLKFRPGMVFDDLRAGEDVATIDTKRPNTNLENYRKGQLRAVAAGTHVTYSSLAKDYGGSYSSQRQELVEAWGAYGALSNEFIGRFVRPVYERLVSMAILSGEIEIPEGADVDSLNDALYVPPQMPWIDPGKEADAFETLERNGHASGPEIIRRRGQNPSDVIEQEAHWRKLWRDKKLAITADPATDQQILTGINDAEETKDEDEDERDNPQGIGARLV